MVDRYIGKKYKLQSSVNFDEFMKALGVGFFVRKMGNTVSPVIELKKEGDSYVLSSKSTFKDTVQKFKPGTPFENETADGRKVKSTFSVDGSVLHEQQVGPDSKITTIERTFTNEQVKIILKFENITSTRIYKAE